MLTWRPPSAYGASWMWLCLSSWQVRHLQGKGMEVDVDGGSGKAVKAAWAADASHFLFHFLSYRFLTRVRMDFLSSFPSTFTSTVSIYLLSIHVSN